jgi:4-carboxymuconolactone decarboxylase
MTDPFPLGEKVSPASFTGVAYLKNLVAANDIFNYFIGNVVFEPGTRNFWHTHPAGQILLTTEGEGYYQERGKPPQLLKPGSVVQIPPNVEHWHGATPTSKFSHVAITNTSPNGLVNWLTPVTDDEYPKS